MGSNLTLTRCIDLARSIDRDTAVAAITDGRIDEALDQIGFDDLESAADQLNCAIDVLAVEGDDYTGAAQAIAIGALDEIVYPTDGDRRDINDFDGYLYTGGMSWGDNPSEAFDLVSLIAWFDQALLDACNATHPSLGSHLASTASRIAGSGDLTPADVTVAVKRHQDSSPHPEGTTLCCPHCGNSEWLRMHALVSASARVVHAGVDANGQIEAEFEDDETFYFGTNITGQWTCIDCYWEGPATDLSPVAE